MKKLVEIITTKEIESCNDCPYWGYDCSKRIHFCDHEDGDETLQIGLLPIPIWCPLPNVEDP